MPATRHVTRSSRSATNTRCRHRQGSHGAVQPARLRWGACRVDDAPPSTAGKVLSGLLLFAGGLTLYVGTVAALSSTDCYGGDGGTAGNRGLAAMGVGAAAVALGSYLFYLSAKTDHAQQTLGSEHEPPSGAPSVASDPHKHATSTASDVMPSPSWREQAWRVQGEVAPARPAFLLPVFSRTF